MIVVRLLGGLGNQMFQYAAGLRLAERHGTTLHLDLTLLLDRTPRENFTFRDFDLGVFGIEGPIASSAEVRRFRRAPGHSRTLREQVVDYLWPHHFYTERHPAFNPAVLDLPDNTYLEGYFQNGSYFCDVAPLVRMRFRLPRDGHSLSRSTRELAEQILGATNAVCVNVRRGDYVFNPVAHRHHGVCDIAYFERALAWLGSRGRRGPVFVFSDDIEWAKAHFATAPDTIIVGDEHAGPRFATKLWLMTLCHHFVIPNSSFGWWAAWLGSRPDKIVVRPSRWIRTAEFADLDICPPSWAKVDNE